MSCYERNAFVVKDIYCFAFFTGAVQCLPDLAGLHTCVVSVTFFDLS
jgi:hypothetical protein